MGRLLAIDYGLKRTGLAVTDPLRIIATALETVDTAHLLTYLEGYLKRETVDAWVVGMPKNLNGLDTEMTSHVRQLIAKLQQKFPDKPVYEADERFTSRMAQQAMISGGMKKKDRQVKGNVDKISAVLILQTFMATRGN
jgi:putative Holliday junction resolvase